MNEGFKNGWEKKSLQKFANTSVPIIITVQIIITKVAYYITLNNVVQ